jgi:hypothetical protein
MKTKLVFALISFPILLAFGAVSASAQRSDAQPFDAQRYVDNMNRPFLWVNNYLDAYVETLVSARQKLKMTDETLYARIALRLRQAGIRPHPQFDTNRPEVIHNDGYILVRLRDVGGDTGLSFSFIRYASWPLPNGTVAKELVTTWERMLLFHGQAEPPSILLNLDNTLDEFITAYLKANE